MTQQMPASLLNLIEHVELHRSGWWDQALGNVLLGALWLHGRPINRDQLQGLLHDAFELNIPPDRIVDAVSRLLAQGQLLDVPSDLITPADTVTQQFEKRVAAAQLNEDAVRSAFTMEIEECCSPHSPERAWFIFRESYLLPLIDMLGARTLQLISGSHIGDGDVWTLIDRFVSQFNHGNQQEVRRVVGEFFNPSNSQLLTYVTEHLDASFLVKASGMTSSTIAEISHWGTRPPSFRLFLDTNFLFSLLDLHENPSNEAAQMLGKTISKVGMHLNLRMHVLAPTIDELKRTLRASQESLMGTRMSSQLASAALDVGLSGIALRYFRANTEAKHFMSAEEYFDPFLNNLTPVLRARGVSVFNERTDTYRVRQDIVDDLHELMNRGVSTETERQKTYNAALHDSVLWHFVADKRPQVFESPIEATYWVVTNDFGLLSFDKRRRFAVNGVAGVCIHPTELLQILRLWEPRDTVMGQALLTGLRLPFMFHQFDAQRESVSMKILKAMSRFDHIRYLNPESIRDIVLNEAVRAKTSTAQSETEENTIIREALLTERDEVVRQRDAANSRASHLKEELELERGKSKQLQEMTGEELVQYANPSDEMENELRRAREETDEMSRKVLEYEEILGERDHQERIREARGRALVLRGLGGSTAGALVATGLAFGWTQLANANYLFVAGIAFLAWLGLSLLAFTARVQDPDVKEWWLFRRVQELRNAAIGLVVPLLVAIVADAVTEIMDWPRWLP